MRKYTNQAKKIEYNIRKERKSHHKLKDGGYRYEKYNDTIITFDIECSSGWLEDGKVIGYRKGMDAEYWNSLQPVSLCYIWQCSIDGKVYYGRELKTFRKLLSELPQVNTIIWVHNLSYEFHFLANIIEWDNIFARSPHKPMKARCKEFPHIEFRCSYMLTRLSLAAWGLQLGLPKMIGDLDYEIVRTPLTPLTRQKKKYAERDCEVVDAGIRWYLKEYGNMWNIPLTQTGTVRRVVKDFLMDIPGYSYYMKKLIPKNADEYRMLQRIFAGGYTHANRLYSGHILRQLVHHVDYASSYPTVMIAEKYPMTAWQYTGWKQLPAESSFSDWAYIFLIKFTNIKSVSFNTYIQGSKVFCPDIKMTLDNGRVIEAPELSMYMTEQDYLTIKENYIWDDMEVLQIFRSKKDYLPKPFLEYILYLYQNKTTLKGVEEKEDLYLQAKQYINSLFGMCVTSIVQSDVKYDAGKWNVETLTEQMVNEKLDKMRYVKYDNRYFLNYSWGCWVTSYARRNLWRCINSIDHDVIYADTDSIFYINEHDWTWYNDEVTEKLRVACLENGLDFEATRPAAPSGKHKPLGVFDYEEDCSEFITLGAKRYCERRVTDNKLHLTVAGINKGAVELLDDDISNFKDGFVFDKDSDFVTKKLSSYISDQPEVVWPDGYVSNCKYGINIRRTGYDLEMSDEYKAIIKYGSMTIDELPDSFYIQQRGRWIK